MKKLIQLLFLFLCFTYTSSSLTAQIDDGEIAPDWDVTDLNGDDWALEDFMDDGKHVILDFSATWCGPCWNYHNTHILEDIHDDFGPSGSDELFVFMFEGDGDTNDACCYGPSGCNDSSWGNWTDTSYPVVNLTGSDLSIVSQYQIAYFPTLYIINGDHQTVWEVGQATYGSWVNIIEESFSLEAEVDIVPLDCGEAELSVSSTGGSGNVNYMWSNGQWGESVTVEPGTYSVTIEDAIGYFVVIDDIEVSQDQGFTLEEDIVEDVSCAGEEDGTIYVDITASGDVDYEWSNGDSGDYINDLEAGTYELTVTNEANGCMDVFEFTVDEPQSIDAEYSAISTSCGEANGEIEIFADGGAGNFAYDFGFGYTTENIAGGLDGGEMIVYIQDENGCEIEVEVYVPESEPLVATLIGADMLNCVVSNVTFTVEPNTSNTLNYSWTNENGEVISTESGVVITAAGNYTVELVDLELGCTYQESFSVLENFEAPELDLSEVLELDCNLSAFDMSYTTSDQASVVAFWTYTNENGELVVLETETLTVELPGTYTLTVQDVTNGCESSEEFTVNLYENYPSALYTSDLDEDVLTITSNPMGENILETWVLNGVEITLDNGVIVFEENGSYELCYIVENECGTDEYCEVVEVTGIISSTSDFQIDGVSIYASDQLINIEHSGTNIENTLINIVDVNGQSLYRQSMNIPTGLLQIDASQWPTGVYFINIETKEGLHATKVFKP